MICCDEGGGQATMNWENWLNDDDEEIEIAYITKEVTCGYKCCNRAYEIKSYEITTGVWIQRIIGEPTTNSYYDCISTEAFYDCLDDSEPRVPVPCNGDCEEDISLIGFRGKPEYIKFLNTSQPEFLRPGR